MKKLFMTCAVLALLALSVTTVSAQVPIVQVVFDQGLNQQTKACQAGTIDSLFIVAKNFDMWMTGIEFAVQYPAGISYMSEVHHSDLSLGSTPMGVGLVWSTPVNAFQTVKLITVFYVCDVCYPDSPVAVIPHWQFGYVRATRYPDLEFVNGVGWTSVFCPDEIPVEDTTWGTIKAMYEN